jgi:hypothetical protein
MTAYPLKALANAGQAQWDQKSNVSFSLIIDTVVLSLTSRRVLCAMQTVDEQNQELRGAVSSMQNENVQLSQLIAEDNRAALEREGRTRLFLEREYREQLKVQCRL